MPIYLLHFDRPLKHARHYLGWSASMQSLHRRMDHHENGTSGARLMEEVKKAGIRFELARVWPEGTRQDERRMKQRGHKPDVPDLPGCAARGYSPRTADPGRGAK